MVSLSTQQDFRRVQSLPFCYWCGQDFHRTSATRDHIPPKATFAAEDRQPCLWLPAHDSCNGSHKGTDQLAAQLIGLKWGRTQADGDRKIVISTFGSEVAAIANLDIRAVVWRWVRGFHAALYGECMPGARVKHALETPFPHAETDALLQIERIKDVHRNFLHEIKTQRALQNLDRITSNNGKLTYECVWCKFCDADVWACVFALNIHDWKDLGLTPGQPARGCAGSYILPSGLPPNDSTRMKLTPIIVPNRDKLDPFAA
ncbi:MAG TPA: hypothetical protein VLV76_01245 [Candidatus Acidoferrum sp.]|nr:hypothetical protein [Candidatus Acidoferrum sp.]